MTVPLRISIHYIDQTRTIFLLKWIYFARICEIRFDFLVINLNFPPRLRTLNWSECSQAITPNYRLILLVILFLILLSVLMELSNKFIFKRKHYTDESVISMAFSYKVIRCYKKKLTLCSYRIKFYYHASTTSTYNNTVYVHVHT